DPAATRARRFVEEMTAALRPLVVAGDDAAADLAQQRAVVGPRGRDAQDGVLAVRRDRLTGLRPEPARRLAGCDGADAVAQDPAQHDHAGVGQGGVLEPLP